MRREASRTSRVEASTSWVEAAIRPTFWLISATAWVMACMLPDISWATAACCSTAVEIAEEISLTSPTVWPIPAMAEAASPAAFCVCEIWALMLSVALAV